MEKFYIEATGDTPSVHFDPSLGLIELRGNSVSADSGKFYQRIIINLEEYISSADQGLTANLSLWYFNTSSAKCIMDLLMKLNKLKSCGKHITINWYYDREDDEESG